MFYRSFFILLGVTVALSFFSTAAFAQAEVDLSSPGDNRNPLLIRADQNSPTPGVSPARRINRRLPKLPNEPPPAGMFRNIDGSGNNRHDPLMGSAHKPLLRLLKPDYGDGMASLAGQARPSARLISNSIVAQPALIPNRANASDFIWQWGQFLDHDIALTDGVDPPEAADIPVPAGDPQFDPDGSGDVVIPLNRSIYDPASGTDPGNPRQQINEITGWIDASHVYGSDTERARALRSLDGSGRLRTSPGNLLPFNDAGLPNAGGDDPSLFLAGDVRANEQVGLIALHTLFMREHNWQANRIRAAYPRLSGDQIYERARRIVGAEIQAITFREFLPALLGAGAIPPYRGYQPEINAAIANVFSSASFRYGHSAVSPTLLRLDARGNPIEAGHLALRDAFFAPQRIIEEGGIEPLLRGLAAQVCQRVDRHVVDDLRNFLFGPPGAGGFDLPALNIQRGRDHGLPSYNAVRVAFGLGRMESFAQISSDPATQTALAEAYASVDDIDAWVGGLAEDRLPGALVGELIATVLIEQFTALRDGDRFWYERLLRSQELERVRITRLADIIRRNTTIGREIPDDVFHVRHRPRGAP